jgi:RNA polymerase sigma factor (TIGR02999 family)
MGEITVLLERWTKGDAKALEQLVTAVHGELRQIASGLLVHERRDHTLQPTELVHEAYLRLAGTRAMTFEGRRHFYGAAAQAMRRVLVDHARHRNAGKRGGPERLVVPLEVALNLPIDLRLDFARLDDALTDLAALAPDKAKVVELRYFAGLSLEQTGDVLGLPTSTVRRHWAFARAWLYRSLSA